MPQRGKFGSATTRSSMDESVASWPSDPSERPASPSNFEEMVATAFNSPVDNLQDVFGLVFDVMKRQQVVIASLRDDLDGLRRDSKLQALESEVKKLREELATRPVAAQPVVVEQPQLQQQVPQQPLPATTEVVRVEKEEETCVLIHEPEHLVEGIVDALQDKPDEITVVQQTNWGAAFHILRFKSQIAARRAKTEVERRATIADVERRASAFASPKSQSIRRSFKPHVSSKRNTALPPAPAHAPPVDQEDEAAVTLPTQHAPTPSTGAPAPAVMEAPSMPLEAEDVQDEAGEEAGVETDEDEDGDDDSESPRMVTADLICKSEQHVEDATLLVRHVRDNVSKEQILDLLRILEPWDAASPLDKWGFTTLAFPSKVNAMAARSLLDGLELNGCRVEAQLSSSAQERQLTCEIERAESRCDKSGKAAVLTSLPATASEEDIMATFPRAVSCAIVESRAALGHFKLGRVTFETVAAARKAQSAALRGELRLKQVCVGARTVEAPAADTLRLRVLELEKLVCDVEKRQTQKAADAASASEERQQRLESKIATLKEQLEAKDRDSRLEAAERATAGVEARLSRRLSAIESDVEVVRASSRAQADHAMKQASENVLGELVSLNILTHDDESGAKVANDELFASVALGEVVEAQRFALHALEQKALTVHELADDCQAKTDGPVSKLARRLRAEFHHVLEERVLDKAHRVCRDACHALEAKTTADRNADREATWAQFRRVEGQIDGMCDASDKAEAALHAAKQAHKVFDDKLRARDEERRQADDATSEIVESLAARLETLKSLLDTRVADCVSEEHVQRLVHKATGPLHDELRRLSDELDVLRREVTMFATRDDVKRFVTRATRDLASALQHQKPHDDDALMIGSLPYRCLGCNRPTTHVHGKHADKVVHAGLSPIPATKPPESPWYSSRVGALRPLHRHAPPAAVRRPDSR